MIGEEYCYDWLRMIGGEWYYDWQRMLLIGEE
jgi:hypothetical protein